MIEVLAWPIAVFLSVVVAAFLARAIASERASLERHRSDQTISLDAECLRQRRERAEKRRAERLDIEKARLEALVEFAPVIGRLLNDGSAAFAAWAHGGSAEAQTEPAQDSD